MSTIINFVGGPGSGKTALCSLLFAELKMRGLRAEYVPEIAKNLVWTKQFDLLNNQHYVTMRQYELLEAINGKVDFILTDGPLLHGIYYNRHNKDNYCDITKVEKMILSKISSFENIFLHVSKGVFPYEHAGRLETEEESRSIGLELLKIMDTLKLPYKKIVSGREAIKDILDYVTEVTDVSCSNYEVVENNVDQGYPVSKNSETKDIDVKESPVIVHKSKSAKKKSFIPLETPIESILNLWPPLNGENKKKRLKLNLTKNSHI